MAENSADKIPTSLQEQLDYTEIPKPPGSYFGEPDPFACFAEIMAMLKKQPKPIQKKDYHPDCGTLAGVGNVKYARVFLKGTDNPLRWIDVPLHDGPFAGFCSTVRIAGCIMPQHDCPVWVPFDQIKYMIEIETTTASVIWSPIEGKPN